ncbi:hypothetical protein L1887_56439 [Cichorium endivia]|nr:hypothetical protein L1887_56439 [Cichorium endivia]
MCHRSAVPRRLPADGAIHSFFWSERAELLTTRLYWSHLPPDLMGEVPRGVAGDTNRHLTPALVVRCRSNAEVRKDVDVGRFVLVATHCSGLTAVACGGRVSEFRLDRLAPSTLLKMHCEIQSTVVARGTFAARKTSRRSRAAPSAFAHD